MTSRPLLAVVLLTGALAAGSPSHAAFWKRDKAQASSVQPGMDAATRDALAADIQAALAEDRTVDAAALLDRAAVAGAQDARFMTLRGETSLARSDPEGALAAFRQATADPAWGARARQGEGLALSALGRSNAAMAALLAATKADPALWKAWNGLGREYDRKGDWPAAEAAYARALDASGRDALPLNNRGYSRLLQGRTQEAITDLVAALERKPDLAAARGNLRLALALQGDYARASARGAGGDDQAALLNNAGFVAVLRGDYGKAIALLDQASQTRGAYYPRAEANRKLAASLQARADAAPSPTMDALHGN